MTKSRSLTAVMVTGALLAAGWGTVAAVAAAAAPVPGCDAVTWSGYDGATTTDQVYVAGADGTNRTLISTVDSGTDPTANSYPQWSPDGTRIAWTGSDGTVIQIYVADADGTNRGEISTVDADPDPTGNSAPQWRPRVGAVALASSATGVVVGKTATFTVTASSTCRHSNVEVASIVPPCLSAPVVSVTQGTATGSTWTIGNLDGTATATITGTVATAGNCTTVASLTSAIPAPTSAVSTAVGGTAKVPCPTTPHGFTDVPSDSFAAADITCIKALDITTGTTPTTYSPNNFVTREQMAAFLARLIRANTTT